MISLSERLKKIANYIECGEDIADIGTDHGYLPLYLLQQNPERHAVFTDVNEGPLTKTKSIIMREFPDQFSDGDARLANYDIRLGGGLEPLEYGEVDTVVIAGMGGLLIRDILAYDTLKTRSFDKIILQPRTASDKLRKWLYKQDIYIFDEDLAYENGRLCEIIAVKPGYSGSNDEFVDEHDFEFSPILVKKAMVADAAYSQIVNDWFGRLLKTEREIENSILSGLEKNRASVNGSPGNLKSMEKLTKVRNRISKLTQILDELTKSGHRR